MFPASSVIILDDVTLSDTTTAQQHTRHSNINNKNNKNNELLDILTHISRLVSRDCNHFSISCVIVSHHLNLGAAAGGTSGNSRISNLIREIKNSITSYTIFKQSNRELRNLLTSLSNGPLYDQLKLLFNQSLNYDLKILSEISDQRRMIPPTLTFRPCLFHDDGDDDDDDDDDDDNDDDDNDDDTHPG